MIDLDEVRKRHTRDEYQGKAWCEHCCEQVSQLDFESTPWPCDAIQLVDEVEQLRVEIKNLEDALGADQ
jgi:predicted  nucleic acid-binding Zn-ribbon protein